MLRIIFQQTLIFTGLHPFLRNTTHYYHMSICKTIQVRRNQWNEKGAIAKAGEIRTHRAQLDT